MDDIVSHLMESSTTQCEEFETATAESHVTLFSTSSGSDLITTRNPAITEKQKPCLDRPQSLHSSNPSQPRALQILSFERLRIIITLWSRYSRFEMCQNSLRALSCQERNKSWEMIGCQKTIANIPHSLLRRHSWSSKKSIPQKSTVNGNNLTGNI